MIVALKVVMSDVMWQASPVDIQRWYGLIPVRFRLCLCKPLEECVRDSLVRAVQRGSEGQSTAASFWPSLIRLIGNIITGQSQNADWSLLSYFSTIQIPTYYHHLHLCFDSLPPPPPPPPYTCTINYSILSSPFILIIIVLITIALVSPLFSQLSFFN